MPTETEDERHANRLARIQQRQDEGSLTQEHADEQRANENERHAKIVSFAAQSG